MIGHVNPLKSIRSGEAGHGGWEAPESISGTQEGDYMPRRELTREDMKWATSTKHHLAKANDAETFLFCVELDTMDKNVAVGRAEALIELLASWGYSIKKAGEKAGHFRPALIKGQ